MELSSSSLVPDFEQENYRKGGGPGQERATPEQTGVSFE